MTKYSIITDAKLQHRICTRYSAEMAALEKLGFRRLAFTLEARGPFSALGNLLLLPLMFRANEVLVFPFPLRVGVANVLLAHSEPSSIAFCMGPGVKFYTQFSDHSLLISSTVPSHAALQNPGVQHPDSRIFRTPPCATLERAWSSHKRSAAEMEAQGRLIGSTNTFADYVEIAERVEADLRHAESTLA